MKHRRLSPQISARLFVSICLITMGLNSCQKNHANKQQAAELEQKINLLNSHLATLENSENGILFLSSEIKREGLRRARNHNWQLEWIANPAKQECILNIRSIHQAVRAHQNLNAIKIGAPLVWEDILGPGKYIETPPKCLHQKEYILAETIPHIGTAAATCPFAEKLGHHPKSTEGW